jgi:hypothetical protein
MRLLRIQRALGGVCMQHSVVSGSAEEPPANGALLSYHLTTILIIIISIISSRSLPKIQVSLNNEICHQRNSKQISYLNVARLMTSNNPQSCNLNIIIRPRLNTN